MFVGASKARRNEAEIRTPSASAYSLFRVRPMTSSEDRLLYGCQSGGLNPGAGEKVIVFKGYPTAPHYGGAAMRLEADREKAGAS